LWIDTGLFDGFADSAIYNALVRIARTAWDSPSITVMHPWRAVLQQDGAISIDQ
jgi:hypothetical protein